MPMVSGQLMNGIFHAGRTDFDVMMGIYPAEFYAGIINGAIHDLFRPRVTVRQFIWIIAMLLIYAS
jgi:hypothetical protein